MSKMTWMFYLSLVFYIFSGVEGGNFDCSGRLNIKDDFVINDTLDDVDHEKANVVLLFGQSNASGVSYSSCLKERDVNLYNAYINGYNNIMINYNCDNFSNYSSQFVTTKLGQGMISDCFGPEIGIAETLSKATTTKTFIIKYAYGGTTLKNQWLNGVYERGGLYKSSLKFTKQSLDYLISKGYDINITGLCWMQGENDAQRLYRGYYKSTESLLRYYREDLQEYNNDFKFIDAYIRNSIIWLGYGSVNDAKRRYSETSTDNYLIDTISMGLTANTEPFNAPDLAHYDSLSMVDLGRAFGNYLLA